MLRSNTNEARARLMQYITEWTEDEINEANEWNEKTGDPKRYDATDPASVSAFILDQFREQYAEDIRRYGPRRAFEDWAQGLALGGLFCYYYNREAKDDVKQIYKETDAEADRFTEEEAMQFLTGHIYNEITRRAGRRY